ncbi:hypothetical protein D3C81_1601810 [compost metagenome]
MAARVLPVTVIGKVILVLAVVYATFAEARPVPSNSDAFMLPAALPRIYKETR